FASDRLIQENPTLVAKVLDIYKKALRIAIDDPAKAGAALKAMVPDVDADIAAEEFAASARLIDTDLAEQDGLGAFEPELLAETWRWVAKAQDLPEDSLDPETSVTREFIPE
ncbi:MAG TPA: sulfonate/nitrate transporter, partial [Alcanivorax sp.]|nr:sulfonate/nitrate transporter [Alcanivorax sp.]